MTHRSRLPPITDKVIPLVKEWQARPLESVNTIVWLDAMFYKVREEGKVQTRCVYNILRIRKDGRKELLGMYISESEGANFWLSILTDLQHRGVEDILIACIDNLKGFRSYQKCFPPDRSTELYSTSDPQLVKICSQQGSERVY